MTDYKYVKSTGVIIPDTEATLEEVQNEYKLAFGQDLDVSPSTPQGLLISVETLARNTIIENNAALANQINPNEAGGIFLDATMALTGSARVEATFSQVIENLGGVPSTLIPTGSQAQVEPNGALFQSLTDVTLDGAGNGSTLFQALEAGAFPAPAGTLTKIITDIPGWETCTNPDDAIVGQSEQSDQQARIFRRNTLALQGQSTSEAILSELMATPGVKGKPFYRENYYDVPLVIGAVTILPKSVYACVDGATNADIANALATKKPPGAAYTGTIVVPYTDPYSGQISDVKFDRPEYVFILARATVKAASSVADPVTTVRSAIVAYANGLLPNEDGLVVGANVSPFELAGAVNEAAPGIYVQKMEISLLSPVNYVVAEIPIEINQRAIILSGSIQVIVLTT